MDVTSLLNLANQALSWIGFGTLVGLIALATMPDSESERNIASVLMAAVGALVGCALLKYFYRDQSILPISGKGFLVGLAGSISLLVFYRVLGSYWNSDSESGGFRGRVARRRQKRKYLEEV